MKTLKLTTLLLAVALVFGSTSCKYEDGPGLSLRTKKARVTGEWEVEKYIYSDGTEDTDTDGEGTYVFEKDGTGKIEFSDPGFTGSFPFEWEFTDSKKKIKITIDFLGTKETDESTIVRLTNKEMWLEDSDNDQIHLKAK